MDRASSVGLLVLSASQWGCVSTPPPEPIWVDPKTEVRTWDASGAPTDGQYVPSPFAGAFELPADLEEPPPQDPDQDPEARAAEQRRREAMIRATFGNAVSIADDGRVTKMFPLSQGSGSVFEQLVKPWDPADPRAQRIGNGNADFGGPDHDTTVLDRLLGPDHVVDIVLLRDFGIVENFSVPAKPEQIAVAQGGKGAKTSLVIVTAMPSSLAAFQRALDLFYVNMPQIEIEVKVVEYSTTDTLSFGISQTGSSTDPDPTFNNLNSGRLVQEITSQFPLTAPFVGASNVNDQGIIRLGGIHDSWELSAVLQMLETNAVADVLSQPKLVVRNGGTATVQTATELPYPQGRISTAGNVVESNVLFKEVGIVMTIQPEIAGTDTVTLLVHASVSAATGFAATEPIPTPIVAKRAATTSVHLREGETMVIGGLVSNSTLESEAKFPLLGDIPILGYLFRSTSKQVSKTVLEFHITPTIIRASGG